jgi:hypothetical protein
MLPAARIFAGMGTNPPYACSLDDFQIVSIAVYQKGQMSKPLSDALVPYIYKEDLESEALNFSGANLSEVNRMTTVKEVINKLVGQ